MSKEFMIYAYHPPMKGVYVHDIISKARYEKNKGYFDNHYVVEYDEGLGKYKLMDVVYEEDGKTVKDFRTTERFREQRECGMNVLFLQHNAVAYSGEPFESCELKTILDRAYEGGFDKVIVCDTRLHTLSGSRQPIIGEGKPFATFGDLVEYCRQCLADYQHHSAFYGVYLLDEPTWQTLPQVCDVFRAVKLARPQTFVQTNLLPLAGDAEAVTGHGRTSADLFVNTELPEHKGITVAEAYNRYLEKFAELSGSDNITMDSYPIREQGIYEDKGEYDNVEKYLGGEVAKAEREYYILPNHFPALQAVADTCKKYGRVFGGVSNSCAMIKMRDDEGNILLPCHKAPNEQDMRYQVFAYLAFGAKIYSYYIYWARQSNGPGCYHLEGTTVMSMDGKKLPLYYALQNIHKELQSFAKETYDFSYTASTYVGNAKYLKGMCKDALSVETELLSGEGGVVVEQTRADGKKLYAVVNPVAPAIDGMDKRITVRLGVKGEAEELRADGYHLVKTDKDGLTVTLSYGETKFFVVK